MGEQFYLTREEIAQVWPTRRTQQRFDLMQRSVAETGETVTANVEATQLIKEATYVTLSPNAELPNERVLNIGTGLAISADRDNVYLSVSSETVQSAGGFEITLTAQGDATLGVPLNGFLATTENAETLKNKTLDAPKFSGLNTYADDAAADAAGLASGTAYLVGRAIHVMP